MAPRRPTTLALGLLALVGQVLALGQHICVEFKSSPTTFTVVNSGKAVPILISSDDWPGVQRAAFDFASDIESVTGVKPTLKNVTSSDTTKLATTTAIIVGTLGKSTLIDEVVNRTKLDVSFIRGRWESFIAKEVKDPLPGLSSAYVVIGADKRGSIFALYDHSEQFGAFICNMMTKPHRDVADLSFAIRCLALVLVRPRPSLSIVPDLTLEIGGQTYRRRSTIRCSSAHGGARTALRR